MTIFNVSLKIEGEITVPIEADTFASACAIASAIRVPDLVEISEDYVEDQAWDDYEISIEGIRK